MRAPKKDQGVNSYSCTVNTTSDARNASVTSPEKQFMEFVRYYGASELMQSLRYVHDLALYHSDVPITGREKEALFDLKVLWENLGRVTQEY